MDPAVELLSRQMSEAYDMLVRRLDGLTEREFWWEPGPEAWTVRKGHDGRWHADYQEPDPDPSPITTIGWRLVHVATCKVMYQEHAFGAATTTWPELDEPHSVEGALRMLDDGQRLLVASCRDLDAAGLHELRRTNWGEEWPTWRILWTMVHHDLWHGGEIGALRDLHRVSAEDASSS